MISPKKFASLGNNQKIYKIASSLRSMETASKEGRGSNPAEVLSYCASLEGSGERKIKEALLILQPVLALNETTPPRERLKILNFAFHGLLAILDKKEDSDGKFSFLRFDGGRPPQRYPWALVLDNLRSPMNVGSIFRSGDGFGVGEISLCGICPRPPDPKVLRTALGAEGAVPWNYFARTEEALAHWRARGYGIYALELAEPSLELGSLTNFNNCAFIIGNEEFGITESILALADAVVRIPMDGVKNSLNAANCAAVLAYEAQRFFRQ